MTVWGGIALLSVLYIKGIRLSVVSLLIVLIAACLHTIGGHYTFAHVPCGEWIGQCFGIERNCYDRLGHFVCGLLAIPVFDVLSKCRINLLQVLIFGTLSVMGVAALYEIFEWCSTSLLDKHTFEVYVAIQGDPWDAQKDMFLCFCGALLSVPAGMMFFFKRRGSSQ